MGRARRREETQELTGEALLESMRDTRDTLVSLIKKGYGDERNRLKIEHTRERVRQLEAKYPTEWAAIAKERPRALDDDED